MIVDGPGDLLRFSLSFCVKAANNALEFREFADHLGNQIAFGQLGGTVSVGNARLMNSTRKPLLGKPTGKGAHALDLIGVASELRVKSHLGQFREIVGEPTFLIGSQKNLASANLARNTRSCPALIRPLASRFRFITAKKCGANSPSRRRSAKYF